MNAAQIHRGPDGAGEFYADNVALLSRRLSIIDLQGGDQPLFNTDKSLALVINGEIYNYLELRERLRSSGHDFRTDVDGEVILHLYEKYQLDFVRHLRGMFAFALWDEVRGRLVLARDRMGEKPLYLFESEGRLLFASELKGLLHSGLVPFEMDPHAVDLYFHYQYVPEPLTAVKGVRKLDAARMLIVETAQWRVEEKSYWNIDDARPVEGDPPELIRQKLEEVSKLQIRSDVPVGVALSGGLDSSAVASFAAKANTGLRAFSVGYTGRPESDERSDAEELARHLEIPFFDVELDTPTIVEFFPELNYWRDDPVADIAGFGYYAVMKLARDHGVPVLLQGQGGDELFWGYPELRLAVAEAIETAESRRNPLRFGGVRTALKEVRRRFQNSNRLELYKHSPDFASAIVQTKKVYSPAFAEQIRANDVHRPASLSGDWHSPEVALTAMVCATYLRENGITQGDRLGMASSVEMRLPLLDHEFVETVIGLRKCRSDAKLPPKHWLKEAMKNVLPDHVLNRPKRGFAPPTREWHAAIFAAHGDSLVDGHLVKAGILSREGAADLSKGEFPAGAITPLSFKALVLEQWCRQMLKITEA